MSGWQESEIQISIAVDFESHEHTVIKPRWEHYSGEEEVPKNCVYYTTNHVTSQQEQKLLRNKSNVFQRKTANPVWNRSGFPWKQISNILFLSWRCVFVVTELPRTPLPYTLTSSKARYCTDEWLRETRVVQYPESPNGLLPLGQVELYLYYFTICGRAGDVYKRQIKKFLKMHTPPLIS